MEHSGRRLVLWVCIKYRAVDSTSTAVLPKIPHSNCCKDFPIGLYDHVEAHFWDRCSAGFLGERLYFLFFHE